MSTSYCASFGFSPAYQGKECTERNVKDALGTQTCLPQSRMLPGRLWLFGSPFTWRPFSRVQFWNHHRGGPLPSPAMTCYQDSFQKIKSFQDP